MEEYRSDSACVSLILQTVKFDGNIRDVSKGSQWLTVTPDNGLSEGIQWPIETPYMKTRSKGDYRSYSFNLHLEYSL